MYRNNKKNTEYGLKISLGLIVLAVIGIAAASGVVHFKQSENDAEQKKVAKVETPGQLPDDGPGVKAASTEVKDIEVSEPIPFMSSKVEDTSIEYGTTRILIPGVPGSNVKIYTVRIEDGVETSRVLKSESLIKVPVNEIISVGSKVVQAKPAATVPPPSEPTTKCDKNGATCD